MHEATGGRTGPSWLTHTCEQVLDQVVVVLATWTVVYHACLLLRLGVPWAVGLELVALAGWALWLRRARPAEDESSPPAGSPSTRSPSTRIALAGATALVAIAAVAGAVTAMLVAVGASWPLVAAFWLTAAVAGTVAAMLTLRRTGDPERQGPGLGLEPGGSAGLPVALVCATALAVLSMFTVFPNPDDLYYVNLSQWVVEEGTFPVRDTIFADLVYPMSSWPPVASYDALVGTLARIGGVPAASVVYLVVPPAVTFLSVLALWRLLRAWRVRALAPALLLGLAFLLLDGGPGYAAPGNLFLTRLWQGKVILLCLLVPLLLVYALRYAQQPTGRRAGWLFAGGVAAVGLSTTAMFLVPLIALGGAAPLVLRKPGLALRGFAAMAAYPVAAGAVTVLLGGRSADLFASRDLFRFDPAWFGPEIFRDGPVALVAVAAVLAGPLLVPDPSARVTTGVLAVILGVVLVPGVTQLSYDLVGLGPTLWRVSWVVSIAALVGVLGTALGAGLQAAGRARVPAPWGGRLALLGPLALAVALAGAGLPIWSPSNGVTLTASPQYKRGADSLATATSVLDRADAGDLVLAPEQLAITVTVLTTRVKTVAPRDYFMDYLRDDPEFHYAERLTLVHFANRGIANANKRAVARALTLLDVDEVCLPIEARNRARFLRAQDYVPLARTATDRCFGR